MEKFEFKVGDYIKYTDEDEPNREYVGRIEEILGGDNIGQYYVLSNGERILPHQIVGKHTKYQIGDAIEYNDTKEDEIFISKIVEIASGENGISYVLADDFVVPEKDVIGLAKEYDEEDSPMPSEKILNEFKDNKNMEKDLDKYIDITDIPTMKPKERELKIDKLLDAYKDANAEKKKQIEEQIKSLRASLKKDLDAKNIARELDNEWQSAAWDIGRGLKYEDNDELEEYGPEYLKNKGNEEALADIVVDDIRMIRFWLGDKIYDLVSKRYGNPYSSQESANIANEILKEFSKKRGKENLYKVLEWKYIEPVKKKALFSTKNFKLDSTNLPGTLEAQILRLAIIAEMDAASLYEQMAGTSQNERVKKILLDVAREEKTHVGEFEALLKDLDPEHFEEVLKGEKEVVEKVGLEKKEVMENDMKKASFKYDNVEHYLDFIENTLAPDLVESGYEATAEDFYNLANNIKEGYVDTGFMKFLEETLIPDLKESGKLSTAEDFETGIKYWKKAIKDFEKNNNTKKASMSNEEKSLYDKCYTDCGENSATLLSSFLDYQEGDSNEDVSLEDARKLRKWLETQGNQKDAIEFVDDFIKDFFPKRKASSWILDKINKRISKKEKEKTKAFILNHGSPYAVGDNVVLAGCLASEVAKIKEVLGKGKYKIELQSGMTIKVDKKDIFPTNNEDLK